MVQVFDPCDPLRHDFFGKTLHANALRAISVPWSVEGNYSITTSFPFPGCDPLKFLKSYSCDGFTSFSLGFQLGGSEAQLSKFTNGSTGISVRSYGLDIHAKTPGFDEYSSGFIRFTKGPLHLSVQAPCIEDRTLLSPIWTLGVNQPVAKHVNLIAQVDTGNNAKVGIKFQPCAHMHAGVGVGNNFLEMSMYAETHEGVALGFLGRALGPRSGLQVIASKKIGSKSHTVTSPEGKVELPQPILGVRHDTAAGRTSAFVDISIAATAVSTMNFGLKMGVDILENKITDPRFSFHISASESR